MKLELSRAAQRDLEEITQYTTETWGTVQALTYLDVITDRLRGLIQNPNLGRPRTDIRTGYRSLTAEKHIIIYRIDDDRVLIVRVVHAAMDIAAAMENEDDAQK